MRQLDLFSVRNAIYNKYFADRVAKANPQYAERIQKEWNIVKWYIGHIKRNANSIEEILGAIPPYMHSYITHKPQNYTPVATHRDEEAYEVLLRLTVLNYMES